MNCAVVVATRILGRIVVSLGNSGLGAMAKVHTRCSGADNKYTTTVAPFLGWVLVVVVWSSSGVILKFKLGRPLAGYKAAEWKCYENMMKYCASSCCSIVLSD